MTIGRDSLSKADTLTITAIESGVPRLMDARKMIAEFQAMVRNKADVGLAMWIEAARKTLVASFASGVAKDEAAVRAAITLPWSNDQTEGQSSCSFISASLRSTRGNTITTDPRSQRNRVGRRGGQLLTRACSPSCADLPTFVLRAPLSGCRRECGCRPGCGWNWCGALSDHMKVSSQAARSIG